MSVYENEKKPVVFDRAGMMDRLMDDEDLARKLNSPRYTVSPDWRSGKAPSDYIKHY